MIRIRVDKVNDFGIFIFKIITTIIFFLEKIFNIYLVIEMIKINNKYNIQLSIVLAQYLYPIIGSTHSNPDETNHTKKGKWVEPSRKSVNPYKTKKSESLNRNGS